MKGRTYRYFTGKTLYPFGFGLSYSDFRYSNLRADYTTKPVTFSATVTNTSKVDGDEVAQLYINNPATVNGELKGFVRVHLGAGQSQTVKFPVDRDEIHGDSVSIGGGQPNEASLREALPK